MSNLKQLGLGFMQYTQDYDELFPIGTQSLWGTNTYYEGMGWGGQIYPYVKNTQVYQCPDDTTLPKAGFSVVSYGASDNIMGYSVGSSIQQPHISQLNAPAVTVMGFEMSGTYANVSSPLETQAACSGVNCYYSCGGNGSDKPCCNPNPGGPPFSNGQQFATGYMSGRTVTTTAACTWDGNTDSGCFTQPTGRHMDGSNFLLCDGHVKWYRPTQVSSGLNAATSNDVQDQTFSLNSQGTAAGTQNGQFAITFSGL